MFCIPYITYTLIRCNQLSISRDHQTIMSLRHTYHGVYAHTLSLPNATRESHNSAPATRVNRGGREDLGPRLGGQ